MHGWRGGERDSSLSTRVEVEQQKNKEGIKKKRGGGALKKSKENEGKIILRCFYKMSKKTKNKICCCE